MDASAPSPPNDGEMMTSQSREAVSLGALSPRQNLVLGVAAGALCKALNYPLLNFKNRAQQGLTMQYSQLLRHPRTVYRGAPMAIFNLGATTGVQFGATGFFQRKLALREHRDGSRRRSSPPQAGGTAGATAELGSTAATTGDATQPSAFTLLGSSFLGGCVAGAPGSLWELTMIQQQRHGGNLVETPLRLVREHGAGILLRGMWLTIAREGLYSGCVLGVTPVVQRKLMETQEGLSPSAALVPASLVGAVCSVTVTHPLDTVKTCLQGDARGEKFVGALSTTRVLLAEQGPTAFFRGYGWRLGMVSTTFFLLNKIKDGLAPLLFAI